jgi:hypothetical protein
MLCQTPNHLECSEALTLSVSGWTTTRSIVLAPEHPKGHTEAIYMSQSIVVRDPRSWSSRLEIAGSPQSAVLPYLLSCVCLTSGQAVIFYSTYLRLRLYRKVNKPSLGVASYSIHYLIPATISQRGKQHHTFRRSQIIDLEIMCSFIFRLLRRSQC